jgi:hypothetical protein
MVTAFDTALVIEGNVMEYVMFHFAEKVEAAVRTKDPDRTEHILLICLPNQGGVWTTCLSLRNFCYTVRKIASECYHILIYCESQAPCKCYRMLGSDEFGWGFLADCVLYHCHDKVTS